MTILEDFLKDLIREYLKTLSIKEIIIKHKVKNKQSGAYQSIDLAAKIESEIVDNLSLYMSDFIKNEIKKGTLSDKFKSELGNQLSLELSSHAIKY